jgi:transposase
MEDEQRVMIKFLFNDGLNPPQIVEKLEAQFHEDAYSLRAVQFWIDEVRRSREDLDDEPRRGRPSEEHTTAKNQELLNQNPFESASSIAETMHISRSTVLKHLHDDSHFQSFYLSRVPHLLTPDLREQRCRFGREMILVFTAAARDGWHHLVIGDES